MCPVGDAQNTKSMTVIAWIRPNDQKRRNWNVQLNRDKVMKKGILPLLIAAGALAGTSARADEIQFTTLPQPVQTTVVRETHITGPTSVTRVIHDSNGIYAVTVRSDAGEKVVYVNDSGAVVQAPGTTTTVQTTETTQTTRAAQPDEQTVVTYDQVQGNGGRYELIKKEHDKEIYLDHQTGKKVKVERKD
jgi:hypothetical protein